MSAPQLTDANTSREWFRTLARPEAGGRTPSQFALQVTRRRQSFVRLVTYTMIGLVAFTLLGLARFAWQRHSMQAALAAPVPVTAPRTTAALGATPATTTATASAPEPVAAPVTPVAASPHAAVKAKPTTQPVRRTSPFLGTNKLAIKHRAK